MTHNGRRIADEALAIALASGQTIRDAAQTVGIGERTATRRWAKSEFRQRVTELRSEMVSRALGKMADSMATAAETLRSLLDAGNPPAVRLGAARAMLELGNKLREAVELEERVSNLEKQQHRRRSKR